MRTAILLAGMFIANSLDNNFLAKEHMFAFVFFMLFFIMDLIEWFRNINKK